MLNMEIKRGCMGWFLSITGLLLGLGFANATWSEGITEAATVADVASNISVTAESLSKVIIQLAYISGLAVILAGVLQFKAHKDNPQQVPLSKPIVLILIGVTLVFMPKLVSVAGKTAFGKNAGADSSGVAGQVWKP
jgi:intracellular multiplication protein IcmD